MDWPGLWGSAAGYSPSFLPKRQYTLAGRRQQFWVYSVLVKQMQENTGREKKITAPAAEAPHPRCCPVAAAE
jgi:hypothetical protein